MNTSGRLHREGSLLAQLVQRPGKSSVTLHDISSDLETSLKRSFDIEEEVTCFEWAYPEAQKAKQGKRRRSEGVTEGSKSDSYLVIGLDNNTVQVITPGLDEPMAVISLGYKPAAIVQVAEGVWIAGRWKAQLYQFGNSGKSLKEVQYDLKFVNSVAMNKETLVIVGDKIIFVDVKSGKVTEIAEGVFGDVAIVDKHIIVSLRNSDILKIYTLAGKEINELTTSHKIRSILKLDNNHIAALLVDGSLEVVSLKDNNNNSIKAANKIRITSAAFISNSLRLSLSTSVPAVHSFTLETLPKITIIQPDSFFKPQAQITVTEEIPHNEQHEELTDIELLQQIQTNATPESTTELLSLLNSVAQEDKIKFIMSNISNETTFINQLFQALTSATSTGQPITLANGNLGIWLKWLLIFHASTVREIPGSGATLASLKNGVNAEMNGLKGLLALQGRLDLLSAQLQLRNEIADDDYEDAEEPLAINGDAKVMDGLVDEKKNTEVVYVNGENDDADVGDVIAGDEESAESEVEKEETIEDEE